MLIVFFLKKVKFIPNINGGIGLSNFFARGQLILPRLPSKLTPMFVEVITMTYYRLKVTDIFYYSVNFTEIRLESTPCDHLLMVLLTRSALNRFNHSCRLSTRI